MIKSWQVQRMVLPHSAVRIVHQNGVAIGASRQWPSGARFGPPDETVTRIGDFEVASAPLAGHVS